MIDIIGLYTHTFGARLPDGRFPGWRFPGWLFQDTRFPRFVETAPLGEAVGRSWVDALCIERHKTLI